MMRLMKSPSVSKFVRRVWRGVPYRVGGARRRAGGAGDRIGQRTVVLGIERSGLLLLLLLLCSVILEGWDVKRWRRRHRAAREVRRPRLWRGQVNRVSEGEGRGTYEQVVPVGVGPVGEAARLFVFEFTPGGGIGPVVGGFPAIGIVCGKVGGSTTDIRPEELSGTTLELSA
jgi:hypothetical protein